MIEHNQKSITNWFDETYKSRGFSYLRPLKAYEPFLNILNLQPKESVIDIACGPGHFLKLAYERGCKCSGVDISEQAVKIANHYVPKADIRRSNAENLPFSDKSFDVVVCLGALERFINLEVALAQQLRVAKENARFCFLVRNSRSLLWRIGIEMFKRKNRQGHQDAKSLEEWTNNFLSNGFTVKKIIPDQWPLQKFFLLLPLSLRKKLLPSIHKGFLPLQYAGEFIFVLSKETSS